MSKLIYETSTGRSQPKDRDIIAYRIIQSFQPGEITPEEANKLGYELAMKFTKGKHQFVVSTHVDKAHIHNHVEFNSTNLECDGKFNYSKTREVYKEYKKSRHKKNTLPDTRKKLESMRQQRRPLMR